MQNQKQHILILYSSTSFKSDYKTFHACYRHFHSAVDIPPSPHCLVHTDGSRVSFGEAKDFYCDFDQDNGVRYAEVHKKNPITCVYTHDEGDELKELRMVFPKVPIESYTSDCEVWYRCAFDNIDIARQDGKDKFIETIVGEFSNIRGTVLGDPCSIPDYNMIGSSDGIQEVRRLIWQYLDHEVKSKITTEVLIRGETGTGKELVAQALHYNGLRKNKEFVIVDCGVLSENVLESELFGHVKGAFTDALKNEDRIGQFELANGGTIFLDEIHNASQKFQKKLLRVIREKTIK